MARRIGDDVQEAPSRSACSSHPRPAPPGADAGGFYIVACIGL